MVRCEAQEAKMADINWVARAAEIEYAKVDFLYHGAKVFEGTYSTVAQFNGVFFVNTSNSKVLVAVQAVGAGAYNIHRTTTPKLGTGSSTLMIEDVLNATSETQRTTFIVLKPNDAISGNITATVVMSFRVYSYMLEVP